MPRSAEAPTRPKPTERPPSLGAVLKFAVTGAVLAMLADAAIGHAMLWKNDPFWTYWVTDTFLITTVFALGTVAIGVGVARGALVTGVQALVLTTYYWTLSPIGLPSHARWLDLEHTWITGIPVHFGVYYLGYLTALWLWRRRWTRGALDTPSSQAWTAVAVGVGVVLFVGGLQTVLVGTFPGVTWFVMRSVVAIVFTLGWWALAGRDRKAAIGGGVTLTLALMAYTHFLGPVGVPETDLRALAQDSPPLDAHWLSYGDEWLVMFPLTLATALFAFLLSSRNERPGSRSRMGLFPLLGVVAVGLLVVGSAVGVGFEGGPDDQEARVEVTGEAMVGDGPTWVDNMDFGRGAVDLVAQERNPRVTPLPPHDRVRLEAEVKHPDGARYRVVADQVMVDDPLGRFTTWGGVGFDKWHHGRSGVSTDTLPATRSDVVVFALGELSVDGRTVASNVPVHVGASGHGRIHLQVGDPEAPTVGFPGGGFTARWTNGEVVVPERHKRWANAFGSAVLVALLALVLTDLRRSSTARAETSTR